MDDSNVAIRLKDFIDSKGMSHSQFSDKCGIPRPSLSQILSGRNKKISNVIVGQIHKAFPELSVLWLMFGEGPMVVDNKLPLGGNPDSPRGTQKDADDSVSFFDFGNGGSLFDASEFDESQSLGDVSDSKPGRAVLKAGSAYDNKKFATNGSDARFQSNLSDLKDYSEALKVAENQLIEYRNKINELQLQIEKISKNPRKVSHITVYYEDSTFETFVPR